MGFSRRGPESLSGGYLRGRRWREVVVSVGSGQFERPLRAVRIRWKVVGPW